MLGKEIVSGLKRETFEVYSLMSHAMSTSVDKSSQILELHQGWKIRFVGRRGRGLRCRTRSQDI